MMTIGVDVVFALISYVVGSTGDAMDTSSIEGPYCGPVAIYAAAEMLGRELDFRQLLRPDFVGDVGGSSIAELTRAIESVGMYAAPIAKYTYRELRRSPYPIILHVRGTSQKQYDHYVLYIGCKDGCALLFDFSGLRRVPFYRIVSMWDGNGVIVNNGPIDRTVFSWSAYARLLLRVVVVVVFTIAFHMIAARVTWGERLDGRPYHKAVIQGAVLVACAAGLSVIGNSMNDAGLLSHADAATSVMTMHLGDFVPKLTKDQLMHVMGEGPVIVDARFPRDYAVGHIDGAINVPVYSSSNDCRAMMQGIARTRPIVVYCHSKRCTFAEEVSAKLMKAGYRNMAVYRGGWLDWQTTEH